MKMVYKYPLKGLENAALLEVEMRQGSRILALQMLDRIPCLWVMVNTDERKLVRRLLRIYGTGRPIEEDPADLDYIGTVQMGPFVWHVFERKEPSTARPPSRLK